MKTEDLWKLDYCIPSHWPNDMTPPQGEWDREVEPGSIEEKIFRMEAVGGGLTQFFKVIGMGVNAYAEAIKEAFEPTIKAVEQHLGYHSNAIIDEIHRFDEVMKGLNETELVKNGRHPVKSQKPGITLPARIANSGPPEKRRRK